jgi:phosphoribosyl 1,2-cyclic phosphodiesterase
MTLSFCSFSSGSSGNCYLVKTETTAVLIDAGISASRIVAALHTAGTDPDAVSAILLTHEHSDHIRGLDVLTRRLPQAKIYGTDGTLRQAGVPPRWDTLTPIENTALFPVGDLIIRAFPVSHDATDPVGYCIKAGNKSVSIVTDTGMITDEILHAAADSDILVLESNHDVELLRSGRYPEFLKSRILGSEGHLSNVQAAEAILKIMSFDAKPRCIFLAHLSKDNNNPRLAEKTVADILAEMDIYSGRDLYLAPLLRDRLSALFEVETDE